MFAAFMAGTIIGGTVVYFKDKIIERVKTYFNK